MGGGGDDGGDGGARGGEKEEEDELAIYFEPAWIQGRVRRIIYTFHYPYFSLSMLFFICNARGNAYN